MAIRMSTGLKNQLLFNHGLIPSLEYGGIYVYSGAQPASANDTASGSLLATVTADGLSWTAGSNTGGLRLVAIPSLSYAIKPQSQAWVMKVASSGTAGWWRFRSNAFSDVRMDGAITDPLSELFIGSTTLTAGEERFIERFQISFYW